MSVLHHFQDIIDYFLLEGLLSIRRLILHMANQCIKFEVSSLSHPKDILRGLKFKMSHVT